MSIVSTGKLYLMAAGLIGLTTAGGYLYYRYAEWKINSLETELLEVNNSLVEYKRIQESNIRALESVQEEYGSFKNQIFELQRQMNSAERNVETLRETFRDSDFSRLSRAKPELIERRVNDATQQVFQDLESISAN